MHKYTAKLSLLRLINLEASTYDEGVWGFCPRGFCPEGAYVFIELCMEGVLSEGVLSQEVLSGGGFVLPSLLPHPQGFPKRKATVNTM